MKTWIVRLKIAQEIEAETSDEAVRIAVYGVENADALWWPAVVGEPEVEET